MWDVNTRINYRQAKKWFSYILTMWDVNVYEDKDGEQLINALYINYVGCK